MDLINVPITIDNVEIQSGDYVYVDLDGIVICKKKISLKCIFWVWLFNQLIKCTKNLLKEF